MKKQINGQMSIFDIEANTENATSPKPQKITETTPSQDKEKKKCSKSQNGLSKRELKAYSETVLSVYDVVMIGRIMFLCHISSNAAAEVMDFMEKEGYTKKHKKLPPKQ